MVVSVRVPATSANLGPGFDALGLALTLYDEVTAVPVDELDGFVGAGFDEVDGFAGAGFDESASGASATTAQAAPEAAAQAAPEAAFQAGSEATAQATAAQAAPEATAQAESEATAQAESEGAAQARTVVTVTGEGAGVLPTDERHLVVRAMHATFAELGMAPVPVVLRCVNRIPQARGLGSSSAAIVAGVLLARALAVARGAAGGIEFDDAAVLRLASRLEGHPDNVAPCLLGGFTIAWQESDGARAVRLAPAPQVRATVLVPARPGLTSVARAALPATVPHVDAAHAAGRSALLVHALTTDPGLLMPATEDRLHQDYRAPGAPATAALVAALRAAGVPAVVSGAGPSVLVFRLLTDDPELPVAVPADWRRIDLAVDTTGAVVRHGPSGRTLGHSDKTRRRQTGVAPGRRVV